MSHQGEDTMKELTAKVIKDLLLKSRRYIHRQISGSVNQPISQQYTSERRIRTISCYNLPEVQKIMDLAG
jgi:hypothetical protein